MDFHGPFIHNLISAIAASETGSNHAIIGAGEIVISLWDAKNAKNACEERPSVDDDDDVRARVPQEPIAIVKRRRTIVVRQGDPVFTENEFLAN